MTITPAYGRDYKSAKAAREAFNNNVDFIISDMFSQWDGKPVSKSDLIKGDVVTIRYNKLTRVIQVTV